MQCEDLTELEHGVLVQMTLHRNLRTSIVKPSVGEMPRMCVDALIEVGCIERIDETYRVLTPCPGHSAVDGLSPAVSQEVLRKCAGREYTGGAGYAEFHHLSVNDQLPSGSAGGGVPFANFLIEGRKRGSISRLLYHFDANARAYHWSVKLTKSGRGELGDNLKRWIADGATEAELHWIIEHFFEELEGSGRKVQIWRLFMKRRSSLAEAYQREHAAAAMEEHRHDADYWAGPKALRERQLVRLEQEAEE